MKLFLLLFVPLFVFGFEINFNKQFTSTIKPDKLSTRITVSVLKDDERYISPILNKFNEFIKDSNSVEKRGGMFSISPKYKYKNGHSRIIGYTGTLKYEIFSTDSDSINEFIKKVLNLKNDDDVSISISTLRWIVSKNKYTQTIEELRFKAIIWAKQYVSELGKELNSTCTVKKININSHNFRPVYRSNKAMLMSASAMESSVPIPEKTKNTVTLKPTYVMECK